MMTKKTYSIEWNGIAEICIEVDHSDKTEKLLHDVNNFWSGSKERLKYANGDITEAVLKLIAGECFRFIVAEDYGVNHLINKFVGMEGYSKMDGSQGLRIVRYDSIEFELDDMSVLIVETNNDKQSTY